MAAIATETSKEPSGPTRLWFLDTLVEIRASRADLPVSVLEMTVPAGDTAPLHLQDEDERIYVLGGAATFYVGSETVHARAGDTVLIPRGRLHAHRASDFGARWLVLTESGQLERFILVVGREAPAATLPPRNGPLAYEEAEEITRAALEHGIEYFGPPGTLPTDL